MSATHTTAFHVRHYECDAYGHLNNANYARYMEEAAFEASAAVGYDRARYQAMGVLWLARETEIEYLQPLRYGDTVTVKTWVADFRRVRSRRQYEFWRGDDLMARASTDWVYLETATLRPTVIPPEMITAFAPDGLIETETRPRFPAPPPPPSRAFTHRRHVEWRDIDSAGHVNNAAYLNYIEECATQTARAFGWPMQRCADAGFAIVARKHHIEYRLPAVLDDELDVTTYVIETGRATAVRYFSIKRGDELLAQARTLWVWVDIHTLRPIRIPPAFAAAFATNIVPEAAAQLDG